MEAEKDKAIERQGNRETGREGEKARPKQNTEKSDPPTPSSPGIKPAPKKAKKKTSGLSLKSISEKKQYEKKQKREHEEKELHEDFSEEQIDEAWKAYIKRLKKRGRKILASILKTDTPKVEGTTIHIELPNETMKKELEREQRALLRFIKAEIQNTDINLNINVNREATKNYAFTPREKYEKLKEKNPLVEELRKTFDLDI